MLRTCLMALGAVCAWSDELPVPYPTVGPLRTRWERGVRPRRKRFFGVLANEGAPWALGGKAECRSEYSRTSSSTNYVRREIIIRNRKNS